MDSLQEFLVYTEEHKYIQVIINMIIVLVLSIIVQRAMKALYKKDIDSAGKVEIHKKFGYQLAHGIVLVLTVFYMMKQLPIENGVLSAVSTSASLLVVILGFAAQEALSNVINGVFISASKPFELGDRVRLVSTNITGIIEDITLRHTVIRTFENKRLVVPNSVMNKEIIENSNLKDDSICNFLDIDVSYESDVQLAMNIIKDLVRKHKYFYDNRTEQDKLDGKDDVSVYVRELGASGVSLRCTVWTKDVSKNFVMCSDLRQQVIQEFNKNNIEIPYNHIKIV